MNHFLLFMVGTFLYASSLCFGNSSFTCPDQFQGKLLSIVKSKNHSELKFKNKSFTVPKTMDKEFKVNKVYKINSTKGMICKYQEIGNEN